MKILIQLLCYNTTSYMLCYVNVNVSRNCYVMVCHYDLMHLLPRVVRQLVVAEVLKLHHEPDDDAAVSRPLGVELVFHDVAVLGLFRVGVAGAAHGHTQR